METIGLSIKVSEGIKLIFQENLVKLTQEYGYFVYEFKEGDDELEISDGLANFNQCFEINYSVCVFGNQPRSHGMTSTIIDEDIREAFLTKKSSKLHDFLHRLNLSLLGKVDRYYVFFAYEWYPEDRIRFVRGSLEDLDIILNNYYTWKIPLFDVKVKEIYPDLDTPLVFEMNLLK